MCIRDRYSVPAYGNEWYSRLMYDKKCKEYLYHRKNYGPQNKFGYKDFSGVETAVKAVVRGKTITEPSEVDKLAQTIEDAIAALEKKPASTKPGTSDKSPQTGDTSNLAPVSYTHL